MPSSTHHNLTPTIEELLKTKDPKSFLDVGIGFGKWGFLLREFKETWVDNVFPEQWQIKVDGVEIFKPYIDKFTWLKDFYNNIYVSPIQDIITELGPYDIIVAADVIEHIDKEKAIDVISQLIDKANKVCILSIPLGIGWLGNKVVADNEFESHRSMWTKDEVVNLGKSHDLKSIEVKEFPSSRGSIGLFVFRRDF